MKTAVQTFDASILPDHARRELRDFYNFLVGKYVNRQVRPTVKPLTATGTAGALASSHLVGIWKDRDLDDSAIFARTLREQAQKRTLA
jgi:hypothetical protein